MSNKIKYHYLQDPKNPNRILTLATRMVTTNDGSLLFDTGFAICTPFKAGGLVERPGQVVLAWRSGDKHNKKVARRIASGRLEKDPWSISCEEGDVPVVRQILAFFVEELPSDDILSRLSQRILSQ